MADDQKIDENGAAEGPKKKSKRGLILGILLACVLGGGGFFAVYSGMILASAEHSTDHEHSEEAEHHALDLPAVAFVDLDPLVISLGRKSVNKHLRFRASLEVVPEYQADVLALKPRIIDVLNSYLHAVDAAEFEETSTLVNLRAQMLRRIQLVTGEGRVRDLLVLEFVLN